MTTAIMPLRLAFMGSPDFAMPTLAGLLDAGHDIACVYAQPPRPAGRGQKERRCPIHAEASARGLDVRTLVNFKAEFDRQSFAALDLDAAVVAASSSFQSSVVGELSNTLFSASTFSSWSRHPDLASSTCAASELAPYVFKNSTPHLL